MPCTLTCGLSLVFIISMIYMNNATSTNKVVKHYEEQLPSNLQSLYQKIAKERLSIYYYGYILGFIISLIIIVINYQTKRAGQLTTTSIVCLVISVSFITNYFYYMLSPKTAWMLNNINTPEQTKAWLQMYRQMQYYYHMGLVLGIVAVAILAIAFRC